MNKITYTFPADFKVAQLAGVTCTDGQFTHTQGRLMEAPNAIAFAAPTIDGKTITALIAGKPALEALLAAHLAAEAEKSAQKKAAEAAHAQTPRGQREALVIAEYNSYDADAFPGSAKWRKNHSDRLALDVFDAANPDLVEEIKKERALGQKARYNALSDFVKNGS